MSGGAQGTADGTPGWVAAPGLDDRGCNNLPGEASKSNLKLGNLQGLVALAPWYGGGQREGAGGAASPGYLSPGTLWAPMCKGSWKRSLSSGPPCSRLTTLLTQ